MQNDEFNELAGRIEGIGRAVLHLAAALESKGVIDGPQLSQSWRNALSEAPGENLATARKTLRELAYALDDARSSRRSPER